MIETIVNSFDIWTDAQGIKSKTRISSVDNISLEGISRLRELILELAIKGKLASQDPNDEPASKLLLRIEEEKKRLIKKGEIKVPENTLAVTKAEKNFDLPAGWEWTKIRNIGHDWGQKTPDKDFSYIDVSAIDNHKGEVITPAILSANDAPSRARKIVKYGTIIYSTVRPYLKNICVISDDYTPEPIASTAFAILHPYLLMPGRFFYLYFRSPMFVKYVESVQTGIAYPAINDKQFFNGNIPLPPLNEQHRIVAKVDELMALCDKLEVEQFNNLKTHQVLVKTLLETLTKTADANEFLGAWERISSHFDTLFCTEDSIAQLKQTILQLAVMGKLVKQDPNDEPASELLKKITILKEKLIKEGKIKKEKEFTKNPKEAFPFALPKGWTWCIFQEITKVITCGLASTPKYYDEGKIFLSAKNVKPFSFLPDDHKFVDEETYKKVTQNAKPELNDILITRVGAGIGETTVIDVELDFAYYVSLTLVKPFHDFVNSKFLVIWLNSPTGILNAASFTSGLGGSQGNLNVQEVRKFKISLPPLAEQHRIVEKVYELFTVCESLKERIRKSQDIKILLSKAIVEKAVL